MNKNVRLVGAVILLVLFSAFFIACTGDDGGSSNDDGGSSNSGNSVHIWSDAEIIDAGAGDANRPEVAFDSSGNAIAVWYQLEGFRYRIWANRYTVGVGWGTASVIETASSDAFVPKIAFDGSGNAIAVWHTSGNIWANRYTADTGWGAAEDIQTAAGWGSFPQIAFDGSGNAIAVWYQNEGVSSVNSIWANRYTADTGWGTAAPIETDNAGGAVDPRFAFDGSDNAIAVWEHYDGTRTNIWANRYSADTGWGTAAVIETAEGDAAAPRVAFDGNGNAIAVWIQNDGTAYSIWANRYSAVTGWGTAAVIETAEGDAAAPRVAFDGNGNAIATWSQVEGTFNNIQANRYTTGIGWGTVTPLETDNRNLSSGPQHAVDTSGNAIVVWEHYDGTFNYIWANRYTADTGWGTAGPIESNNGGGAYEPQVAIDGNGNAIAVWSRWDTTHQKIWASRYE